MKPIILTFAHYYLPGHLAGGPICSIANMVELLSDEFEFHIITSDLDFGAGEPYKEVKLDQWNRVGKAQVFYTSAATLSLRRLAKLIRATQHDVIYLNSFFDPIFTIQPLIARRLGLITKKPLIIAPRGEFCEGAFTLKHWKKAPYALLSKWHGWFPNLGSRATMPNKALQMGSEKAHTGSHCVANGGTGGLDPLDGFPMLVCKKIWPPLFQGRSRIQLLCGEG